MQDLTLKKKHVIPLGAIGCNHDGVIARRGIVSHHPREEKPRESFPWCVVFVNELLGNLPQLRQPTCSLNYHII